MRYFLLISAFAVTTWSSCIDEAPLPPPIENEEEIITDVVLNFTPDNGESTISVAASDPDGEGPEDIVTNEDIHLRTNTLYRLEVVMENRLAGEFISDEVAEEADEHQLFFEWTEASFFSPDGNGNIDSARDPVVYLDMDANGLPLGLLTQWTTGGPVSNAIFRIVLKHQPDIKSADAGAQTGDTDVDLTWVLHIE